MERSTKDVWRDMGALAGIRVLMGKESGGGGVTIMSHCPSLPPEESHLLFEMSGYWN